MSGRPSVKWGQVHRYFIRRNYTIVPRGGDKYIVAPKDGDAAARSRNAVMIGHKCCSHAGDEVWPCYLQAIKRAFGITAADIVAD
jgi:hypothetical protein